MEKQSAEMENGTAGAFNQQLRQLETKVYRFMDRINEVNSDLVSLISKISKTTKPILGKEIQIDNIRDDVKKTVRFLSPVTRRAISLIFVDLIFIFILALIYQPPRARLPALSSALIILVIPVAISFIATVILKQKFLEIL